MENAITCSKRKKMKTNIIKKNISNNYNNVCYVDSIYALSLYIYIQKNISKNSLFIVSDKIYSEPVFSKIENYIVISSSLKKMNTIERFLYIRGITPSRFRPIVKHFNKKMNFYGHDHLRHSFLFITNGMTLIEDGLTNYIGFHTKPDTNSHKLKSRIYNFLQLNYKKFGYDQRVEKIFLSGTLTIPKEIIHKVEYYDKKLFFKSLSKILDGVLSYNLVDAKDASLLMTQPLSEDNVLSEGEKLLIYKQIIINLNCKVLVKAHPRDLTDYKKAFKELDIDILPKYALAEAIIFNNIQSIKRSVTLFSASNYNLKDIKELEFVTIGTAFNSKLVQKYGVIEPNNEDYKQLVKK